MYRGIITMVLTALAAGAGTAQAQWATLPSGELGYTFQYSTFGAFSCMTSSITVGSCVASGNSVTLERDGATMTMTYTGVMSTITASNISQTTSLGTISTVFGGTGTFLPPVMRGKVAVLTRLTVGMSNDIPGAPDEGFCRPMSPRESGLVSYGTEYGCSRSILLPLPETPGPAHYPYVVFDGIQHHVIGYEAGSYEYTASVGVIPEPGTTGLLATGLILLAGVAVRRRNAGAP